MVWERGGLFTEISVHVLDFFVSFFFSFLFVEFGGGNGRCPNKESTSIRKGFLEASLGDRLPIYTRSIVF